MISREIMPKIEHIKTGNKHSYWKSHQDKIAKPVEGVEKRAPPVFQQILLAEVRQILGQVFFNFILDFFTFLFNLLDVILKLFLDALFNILCILFQTIKASLILGRFFFFFLILILFFLLS